MNGAYRSEPVKLGRGFSIEFRLANGRMDAIWAPTVPAPRLGRKLLPAYRVARDQFLARVASAMGQRILCVDAAADCKEAL